MKLAPELIKLEETIEKKGKPKLELITGGKGPDNPNDWLSPLPDGTMFLFYEKRNPNDPNLGQAMILRRSEKSIFCGFVVNNQPVQGPVIPARFCNKYSLWELLGRSGTIDELTVDQEDQQQQEETLEETNGTEQRDRVQGNSGRQDDGVAGDAPLPGVPEGTPKS